MARPVKSTDLLGLRFVSDPQLAPDGLSAAVVVTEIVDESDEPLGARSRLPATGAGASKKPPRYRGRIELYDLKARGRRRPLTLTRGEYGDDAPRFSPTGGELAFRSVREENGKPQLYVIGLAGGEARRLTQHGAGVGEFAWHPGGEQIAYLSRGDWKDEASEAGAPRRIVKRRWRAEGAGILPTEPAHLYLLDVRSGRSRKLAELTEEAGEPVFSPDGRPATWAPSSAAPRRSARTAW